MIFLIYFYYYYDDDLYVYFSFSFFDDNQNLRKRHYMTKTHYMKRKIHYTKMIRQSIHHFQSHMMEIHVLIFV